MKLNIGCDCDIRPGWVNIDSHNIKGKEVLRMNGLRLAFQNDTFEEICARDILEHFPWRLTDAALKEWYRVLKPSGKIYIQGPNLISWANAIVNKEFDFHYMMMQIFALQDGPGNFHFTAFSCDYLKEKLEKAGFKNIEFLSEDRKTIITDRDHNVSVWAEK